MFKPGPRPHPYRPPMTSSDTPTDTPTGELPVFPTTAPATFGEEGALYALFSPIFARLGEVATIDPALLDGPTPCPGFTVAELRHHVLGWLQFFAAALTDPAGATTRADPDQFALAPGDDPATIVAQAAACFEQAIGAGVAGELVVMSQARMAGDGVLAMALGEYLVHGWDLAVSTGQPWTAADGWAAPAEPALAFLQTMVTPEYRGPDSGFFDAEVPAPADASPFHRLLCFAGRDPSWTPPRP